MPVPSGCDVAMCYPSGTETEGAECYTNGLDCAKGTQCLSTDGESYRCLTYCDETHPCETGTCMNAGSESRPDFGVCMGTDP